MQRQAPIRVTMSARRHGMPSDPWARVGTKEVLTVGWVSGQKMWFEGFRRVPGGSGPAGGPGGPRGPGGQISGTPGFGKNGHFWGL